MTADPTDLAALVARLRGLREKATPGTWSTALDARCVVSDALVEWDNVVTVDTRPNDSALIVAAVNALPTLCDALDALRVERDAAVAVVEAAEAIADYIDDVRKDGSCQFFHEDHEPGETMYRTLRAALAAATAGAQTDRT